jgi:hypothetical protein
MKILRNNNIELLALKTENIFEDPDAGPFL